jgi:hypothetical protein
MFPFDKAPFKAPDLQRLLAIGWAGPCTLAGLLLGFIVLGLGGRVRRVQHTLEFSAGPCGPRVAGMLRRQRFSAITLGHVILGVDCVALGWLRDHEQVHVRQYETWGVFFVPAYLLSSVWQVLRGRNAHTENHFEIQAYALGGPFPRN